jgi:hypothetical protein
MLVSPPDNVCKSHDRLCATWFSGAIRIEHAITQDLPDGTPILPGFVNDGIFWALVARLPGWPVSERRTLQNNGWANTVRFFLRLSAAEPLVVIPWHIWARILGEVRR